MLYILDIENKSLKILGGILYFVGMLFGLSFSFLKPKKLGELSLSSKELKIKTNNTRIIPISQIREIALDYHGYGSWWTHSLHGSKNRFYFETNDGERFDFEIVLQNKQKKHELKSFLKSVSDRINYQVDSKSNFSF